MNRKTSEKQTTFHHEPPQKLGLPVTADSKDREAAHVDWRESCPSVKEKLFHSLLSGCFADVKFLVGQNHKREVLAHKFILLLSSPVFENLLGSTTSTKNLITVSLSEVEPEALTAFLKFIYTDDFEVNAKDATAVLYLAKKYNVGRLVAHSAEFIKSIISTKNVVSILLSAEALGETSISTQARHFLRKNISYVIHEPDFLHLNAEELCQIFASDELAVSELDLFNAAIHWASEECRRQKLEQTAQNYRYVLKNVLYLIRFPLMDPKEFTFHVATKLVLTDAECLNVLMHFNATAKERSSLPPLLFSNKPRRELPTVELNTVPAMPLQDNRNLYESYYYNPKERREPIPPRRNFMGPAKNRSRVEVMNPEQWIQLEGPPMTQLPQNMFVEYGRF